VIKKVHYITHACLSVHSSKKNCKSVKVLFFEFVDNCIKNVSNNVSNERMISRLNGKMDSLNYLSFGVDFFK